MKRFHVFSVAALRQTVKVEAALTFKSSSIYLDYNASAPLRPEVQDIMCDILRRAGNPSSVYAKGRASRGMVEKAREKVAALVGAKTANVTFTSGGTEANVTALSPMWEIDGAPTALDTLVVSAVEHPSVLSGGRFPLENRIYAPVDANGRVDTSALLAIVADEQAAGRRALVSVMAANNETGVIQPIEEIGAALADTQALFHVDAIQAAGRVDIDLRRWSADALSLSAHKIGGPQGSGALVVASGNGRPSPLLRGGGQENWRRAGTENVAAIVGFGAAADLARLEASQRSDWKALQGVLESSLSNIYNSTVVFGQDCERLPNTTCFAVPGVVAETALIALDLAGVAVSSGSACSSGKVSISHVLSAMGVREDVARCALRVSWGHGISRAEIDGFVSCWREIAGRMLPVEAREAT